MSRPPLYGDGRRWGLVQCDSLELLPHLPAASVDAVITDPPYGIGFNAEAWDGRDIRRATGGRGEGLSAGQAFERWTRRWAQEARRVLRPGGYLVAFGAPRTVHRLTAGLEDGGLDVRDQLLWLYGQGVPKSRRVPGGRGTALKPAYEPIVLARAPFAGTLSDNLARHGTGALEIDAARVPDPAEPASPGRWPANAVLSHEADCTDDACGEGCATALLDASHPVAPSRFFYAAKAGRSERDAGCLRIPARAGVEYGGRLKRPAALVHNPHPTVKPLELMRWLVRLVTPPGGVVLDPFTGSGTTGAAVVLEGQRFLGIEREAEYVGIARARIAHWAREGPR